METPTLDYQPPAINKRDTAVAWVVVLCLINTVSILGGIWMCVRGWKVSGWGILAMVLIAFPILFLSQLLISVMPTAIVWSKLGKHMPRGAKWLLIGSAALGILLTLTGLLIVIATQQEGNGC